MHGVKRLFGWMIPRFDASRYQVSLVSLRKRDLSEETLDALACFDTREHRSTVRWLEISGNSGSGKSSLMNAGLLPLVDQGWLWPRTGYEHWRRIGPMMPGEDQIGRAHV